MLNYEVKFSNEDLTLFTEFINYKSYELLLVFNYVLFNIME